MVSRRATDETKFEATCPLRDQSALSQLTGFIAHEALQQKALADRLNIAIVTVDLHPKRARTKLGAATRDEALAKAVVSGEIVP